jgi:hypothetical protein
VLLVRKFRFATGALQLRAVRREFGLRRIKLIGQSIAYLGMDEILVALFAM